MLRFLVGVVFFLKQTKLGGGNFIVPAIDVKMFLVQTTAPNHKKNMLPKAGLIHFIRRFICFSPWRKIENKNVRWMTFERFSTLSDECMEHV
jgi:hypothetical protein